MYNDPVGIAVERCADALLKKMPNTKIMLVHIVKGGASSAPFILRRSAVRLTPDATIPLDRSEASVNEEHARVLSNYIVSLDREHTILDRFLECYEPFRNRCVAVPLFGTINVRPNSNPFSINPSENFSETIDSQSHTVRWEIGSDIADLVAPSNYSKQFLRALYDGFHDRESILKYTRIFEYSRQFACGKAISKLSIDDPDEYIDMVQKQYSQISAVQAALIYGRGVTDEPYLSFSLAAVPLPVSTTDVATGVLIASPAFDMDGPSRMGIMDAFRSASIGIGLTSDLIRDFVGNTNAIANCIGFANKVSSDEFSCRVKRLFRIATAETLSCLYVHWMVLVVQHLIDRFHEGNPQDFYLVCGDGSEFRDKGVYKALLSQEDRTQLSFPPRDGLSETQYETMLRERAAIASDWIAAEHYPWFKNGRHALFFDTSIISSGPIALVGLKGTTWRSVVSQTEEVTRLAIPSCVLCYAHNGGKSIGVLGVSHEERAPSITVKNILIWKSDEWRLFAQTESENILCYILKNILSLDLCDASIEHIAKVAMLLAKDPGAGGTIVIPSIASNELFVSMGHPLSVREWSVEDILAMMAHDGAAIYKYADGQHQWRYRILLTSHETPVGLVEELDKRARWARLTAGAQFPLAFKGSRRWSSALMAFRADVEAVIVISQDGELQLWSVPADCGGKFLPSKVSEFEISRTGDVKRYVFYENTGGKYERIGATELFSQ